MLAGGLLLGAALVDVDRSGSVLNRQEVRTLRLRISSLTLLAVCLALVAIPAVAQNNLYDNGPTNGTVDAWTINTGFIVSDSFTLGSNSQVNGLTFSAWLYPGDILVSGEVSITSAEFGGTTYFDQFVNFTQTGCVTNQLGYNVCNETASLGPVNLNAGVYWLTLENAQTNTTNDPVFWDENSGPSLASENSVGTIPSESFTILGSSGSSTGTTPEPGSIVLFGSGLVGLAGILRRKPF
jgi:PEP-CTERM motif